MQGYCVRCKQKQPMLSATRTVMKNGRRAMIGTCTCCATQMYVAGVWEDEPSAPLTQHSSLPKTFDLPPQSG